MVPLLCIALAYWSPVVPPARPRRWAAIMGYSAGEQRSLVGLEDLDTIDAVVAAVMDAFKPQEKDIEGWQFSNTQQETAGSLFWGCLVLVRLSVKAVSKHDDVGRLQPGAFVRASTLERYLLGHEDYRTFALLDEWKAVAPPVVRGRVASQQLLVRRERSQTGGVLSPAIWEEVQLRLELCETLAGERWRVLTIYKDYHGPAARAISDCDFVNADLEEERNC